MRSVSALARIVLSDVPVPDAQLASINRIEAIDPTVRQLEHHTLRYGCRHSGSRRRR